MKSFKIIPAIDLMDGQCVRLVQGDFRTQTIYPNNPVDVVKKFLDVGLNLIHVIDLDGAYKGKPINLATIESMAATGAEIELGGGLRTTRHIRQALESGVKEVILGSTLLSTEKRLHEWSELFPGVFIAAIDVRDGKVAVDGWRSDTTLSSPSLVLKIENLKMFNRIIYTDISRDGTLQGPNLEQVVEITQITTLPVIVSGGIRSKEDIEAIKNLKNIRIKGIIIGKAFYDNRITLKEMAQC